MFIRRKILLGSLACGGLLPLRTLLAQTKFTPDQDGDSDWRHPNPGRPGRTIDNDLDNGTEDQPNARSRMPPPRLEIRPPPPEQGVWHWRSGHWMRVGESWRWVGGRWDH